MWDNLNVHLAADLTASAEADTDLLQIFHLPAHAPEPNPVEGIRSLLERSIANFIVADLAGPTWIIKRKPKKIQYRPHLINGCLKQTGLPLGPG
ncbi:transposase [Streptosporangium sp. NPDC049078]|uniref:transposase n=1 Tax=Streptosporangium sp. NPDC049078 TaxID=3155767 RepID=UPI0034289342